MNISEFSVRRPVTVIMGIGVLLVLGAVSLTFVNTDLMPKLSFPNIAVLVQYEGAGPRQVEDAVIRTLEGAVKTAADLKNVKSYAQQGVGILLAEFRWGKELDAATADVREKIAYVKRFLPEGVKEPIIVKFDFSEMPVVFFSLDGERDLGELLRMGKDMVAPRLERIDGVASAMVIGGKKREIRVDVNKSRLLAYKIPLQQVVQMVRLENMDVSGGKLQEGGVEYSLRGIGEYRSMEDLETTVIGFHNGSPIHLRDIAKIVDGFADPKGLGLTNQKKGIAIMVRKQSDANVVRVSDRVMKAVPEIQGQLPKGVQLTVAFNSAELVNDSLGALRESALEGAFLVIVILWVFLRALRPTVIVTLSIPLSLLATFVIMYFSDLTINIMTLGGLIIAIGKLVDDSIVVIDNIERHRGMGKAPGAAAVDGTKEVVTAVWGATLATVIVFLPLAFTSGVTGQLFKPFGLTFFWSLMASLLVSFTVIPMISSVTKGAQGRPPGTTGDENGKWWFSRLQESYGRLLEWCLDRKAVVGGVSAGVLAVTIAMFVFVGKEFVPEMTAGIYESRISLPPGTPLTASEGVLAGIEEKFMKLPDLDTVFGMVGEDEFAGENAAMTGETQGPHKIMMMVKMKKGRNRVTPERAIFGVVRDIKLANPSAVISFEKAGRDMTGNKKPIEIKIIGDDLDTLKVLSDRVLNEVNKVQGVANVQSSLSEGHPEVVYRFNRLRSSLYGLSSGMAGMGIKAAVDGEIASRYRERGEEMDIRVRFRPDDRGSLSELGNIPVFSPAGVPVPVRDIAQISYSQTPPVIARENSKRVATVSAGVVGRSLSKVTGDLEALLKKFPLPEGYIIEIGGQYKDMQDAFGSLSLVIVMSFLLIYMVLASLYESLIHPLTIMIPIPFAATGAILALFMTGTPLGVTAFIGLVMLIGIVAINSIVMVDFILERHRSGLPRREAVVTAAKVRLRPILMTALAAFCGLLPVAIGASEGMEVHIPLGRAVCGGLISSTAISLVIVPVLYEVMDGLSARLRKIFPS